MKHRYLNKKFSLLDVKARIFFLTFCTVPLKFYRLSFPFESAAYKKVKIKMSALLDMVLSLLETLLSCSVSSSFKNTRRGNIRLVVLFSFFFANKIFKN